MQKTPQIRTACARKLPRNGKTPYLACVRAARSRIPTLRVRTGPEKAQWRRARRSPGCPRHCSRNLAFVFEAKENATCFIGVVNKGGLRPVLSLRCPIADWFGQSVIGAGHPGEDRHLRGQELRRDALQLIAGLSVHATSSIMVVEGPTDPRLDATNPKCRERPCSACPMRKSYGSLGRSSAPNGVIAAAV